MHILALFFGLCCVSSPVNVTIATSAKVHGTSRNSKRTSMSTFFFLFHFLCGIMLSPNRMEGTLNNAEAAQTEYGSMEGINIRKMEEMKAAAKEGRDKDITKLIGDDPYILNRFDRVPYIDTPLHIAAKNGHTPFAMEMVSFKSSFLTKLNPEGLCPLHVALQNGKNDLALRLLEAGRDLIPCAGRKRIVFLHYVAQEGNVDRLKMFLKASPESIQDMTTRRETVLHVTLKNDKLDAFYFLVGYLRRVQYEGSSTQETEILNRKDDEGNTILHIAVQKNIPKVVELLINCGVGINTKNIENRTALDILDNMQEENSQVREMLNAAGALKASNFTIPIPSTAHSLRYIPSFKERLITSIIRVKRDIPHDTRNALLVITVLIATVTCQGSLTPPGGVWQDSNSSTAQVHQAEIFGNMTLRVPLLTISTTVLIATAAFTNFPMLLLFCALNMLLLSF